MVMHIGLIGGIGPAATDYYYRRLIAAFAGAGDALDLTIVHADTPTLLGNLERDDAAAQVAIYRRLTDRLVAAGADCVAVTSIAGHFCIGSFIPVAGLPVIDLIAEVTREIESRGLKRVGILGTRTVMQTHFYGALPAVEVVPPIGSDVDDVHCAYVEMAAAGRVTEEQCAVFRSACRRLVEVGRVEAVLLGGTDLALVFDGDDAGFPVIDCAAIHVAAIVRRASATG